MSTSSAASLPPEEPGRPSLLGRTLDGRYRLDQCLGEGGIGIVYRATHLKLNREVAIKTLHETYQDNETLRLRFERESQALAAMSHPNIVTITDFGIDDGLPYLVMELIHGVELTDFIERDNIPTYRALHLMRQILRSLAYAHRKGIVHRDLKPANVIVRTLADGAEHVEVLDFGLARFVVGEYGEDKLTRVGTVVGTPAYMPPEQASGDQVDERADVFAAGVMFYEMITGHRPYRTEDNTERLRLQLTGPPPTIAEKRPGFVSPELEALLKRAMTARAEDRFSDAGEMLDALNDLPPELFVGDRGGSRIPDGPTTGKVRTEPPSTPKLAWVVVLAVALAIPAIFGFVAFRFFADPEPPAAWMVEGPAVEVPETTAELPEPTAPALDPWRFPIPEDLAAGFAKLEGGEFVEEDLAPIRRYRRRHRNDPRGALLLAHAYVSMRWLGDAVPVYREAYLLDTSVRGDAMMLQALMSITASQAHGDEGRELMLKIYDASILPEFDRFHDLFERPAQRRALEELREELAAD